MTEKNLILPFITNAPNEREELTFPIELACIACMAELQRKKTSLLRDIPEKLAFISKVHYPLWIVHAESKCLVLDGLGFLSHKFTFKEPTKTGAFIENLKKNSVDHQEFMNALETQAKGTKEFTSPVNVLFKALVADRELLTFLPEYFKSGKLLTKNEDERGNAIPLEIDEKTAYETAKNVTNCLRTIQADAKGLQCALGVLNEEVEFHKRAATYEIERLKEKCELEVASLRPEVDKKVKKLTLKRDKSLAGVLRTTERKASALEKKREKYMWKLQAAEQRKDAVQKRIDTVKRKKSSGKSAYGSYELEKRDREISNIKKEIKAVSEASEKIKREGDTNAKKVEEEFRNAVAQEESKITQLNTACEAKTAKKKQQIDTMTSQAASVTLSLENLMDELKRNGAVLREQVEIDWKLDSPDDAVLVSVPVYLIKYAKRNDERYSLFPPMTISDAGVLNGLRKILTLSSEPRLKFQARPASKKLQDMLTSSVIEKMQSDEIFRSKINAVCRINNLLDRMEFAETLNEGLDEVVKRGWMTSEEASTICERIMETEA